jgi:hypothetical protein
MIFQTVKPEEDDTRRKEIMLLLAADNFDDESQMDMALHGELAGKIVEQIFERASKRPRHVKAMLARFSTWEGIFRFSTWKTTIAISSIAFSAPTRG